jgi:hypothetical protein
MTPKELTPEITIAQIEEMYDSDCDCDTCSTVRPMLELLRQSQRKADALDKLDRILTANKQIHACINHDSILNIIVLWGDEFGATAPTLLEAIEKASAGK